jgi:hypothetical protein
MLARANKNAEDRAGELENATRMLEKEVRERARLEKVVQEMAESRVEPSRNSEQLRRNLENCLKEYENLRIQQEGCSAKLLSMKSERDHKIIELEEARIKIRVLESENKNIECIMTEELEKRRRIIEGLVKEKNSVINELERSKIRF